MARHLEDTTFDERFGFGLDQLRHSLGARPPCAPGAHADTPTAGEG
ncbi:hypothetical protein [Kitasatospora purpeofusca]